MENNSYSGLIADSLRLHVGRNEKLHKMRSGLHVEAMKMIQELTMLEKEEPSCGKTNLEQRGMLQLLNYLIVDYFNWHGFTNTMKTFALETGEKSRPKPRDKLQQELKGQFRHTHLPILLQMVLKESNKADDALLEKSKWEHIPIRGDQIPKKLKKLQGRFRTIKDISSKQKPDKKVKKDAQDGVGVSDMPDEGKSGSPKEKKLKKKNTIAKENQNEANNEQTAVKENQSKKLSNSARNLRKFSKELKSFPKLRSLSQLKSMNESRIRVASAHDNLKKVDSSNGPSSSPKEKPRMQALQKVDSSHEASPGSTQSNSRVLPMRMNLWMKDSLSKEGQSRWENLQKSYRAMQDYPVKGLPKSPLTLHETCAIVDTTRTPLSKVNIRQRMVESNKQRPRVH